MASAASMGPQSETIPDKSGVDQTLTATGTTKANDSERLVKDWQEVLKQGKQLQRAFEKFFENIDLEGNPRTGEPGKDLEFYADQLKDKGDAMDLLVLMELLGRDILPLANVVVGKPTIDYSEDEWEE